MAEIRRLRMELKQTMDMYNSACKEAITAKQKVIDSIDSKLRKVVLLLLLLCRQRSFSVGRWRRSRGSEKLGWQRR